MQHSCSVQLGHLHCLARLLCIIDYICLLGVARPPGIMDACTSNTLHVAGLIDAVHGMMQQGCLHTVQWGCYMQHECRYILSGITAAGTTDAPMLHCLAVACSLCGINTCTVWHFAQYVTGLHRPAWRSALSRTFAESLHALFSMLALAAAWKPTWLIDACTVNHAVLCRITVKSLQHSHSIHIDDCTSTLALCSMEVTHCSIPTLSILMTALARLLCAAWRPLTAAFPLFLYCN